jgi:hypothetical protein
VIVIDPAKPTANETEGRLVEKVIVDQKAAATRSTHLVARRAAIRTSRVAMPSGRVRNAHARSVAFACGCAVVQKLALVLDCAGH